MKLRTEVQTVKDNDISDKREVFTKQTYLSCLDTPSAEGFDVLIRHNGRFTIYGVGTRIIFRRAVNVGRNKIQESSFRIERYFHRKTFYNDVNKYSSREVSYSDVIEKILDVWEISNESKRHLLGIYFSKHLIEKISIIKALGWRNLYEYSDKDK